MKKGQKVSLTSGGATNYWINENAASTKTYSTRSNKAILGYDNDCVNLRLNTIVCNMDDTICVGRNKCKFYETLFAKQMRTAIDKKEKECR